MKAVKDSLYTLKTPVFLSYLIISNDKVILYINKEKLREDIISYLNVNNIKLDAIINVAGIHKMASLVETEYEQLKKLINYYITN